MKFWFCHNTIQQAILTVFRVPQMDLETCTQLIYVKSGLHCAIFGSILLSQAQSCTIWLELRLVITHDVKCSLAATHHHLSKIYQTGGWHRITQILGTAINTVMATVNCKQNIQDLKEQQVVDLPQQTKHLYNVSPELYHGRRKRGTAWSEIEDWVQLPGV